MTLSNHFKKVNLNVLTFGAFTSMIGVYYSSVLGFTGVQVGILTSVSPLINIVLTPVWTFIGDKYHAYKKIMLINSFLSALLGICLMILGIQSKPGPDETAVFTPKFSAALIIAMLLAVFMSPLSATLDTIVLEKIKRECHGKDANELYGKQRAVGSLAYGVGASLIATLADPKKTKMELMFWTYLIMTLVFNIILMMPEKERTHVPLDEETLTDNESMEADEKSSDDNINNTISKTKAIKSPVAQIADSEKLSMATAVSQLISSPSEGGSIFTFWGFVLVQGIGFAIPGNFLFIVMLNDLKAIDLNILAVTAARITLEIPFFYFNSIISKFILSVFSKSETNIGYTSLRWMMTFAVALHGIRLGITAMVIICQMSPWVLVASELLHGIIFSMFYSSAVQIAARLAPPHLIGVSQGMFNAFFGGVGPFLGSIVGGYVYSLSGASSLFFIFALLNLSGALLYALDVKRSNPKIESFK